MRILAPLLLLPVLAACTAGTKGDEGASCTAHTDCDSALICKSDKCVTPYGRTWRLSIISARISDHDPNGDTWDSGGNGLPDPLVLVKVDDAEVLKTQVKTDTKSATWTESVTLTLQKSTRVEVVLYDSDLLFDTPIVTTRSDNVDESELRQGDVSYFAVTGPASADAGNTNSETTTLLIRWSLDG